MTSAVLMAHELQADAALKEIVTLLNSQNVETAIEKITAQLNLNPQHTDFLLLRAEAYLQAGQYGLAAKDASDALRSTSDVSSHPFTLLASSLANLRRCQEALDVILTGLRQKQDDYMDYFDCLHTIFKISVFEQTNDNNKVESTPSHPSSELSCAICTCVFVEPVTLSCGHSYCRDCCHRHLTAVAPLCPLCNQPDASTTLCTNTRLRAIVAQGCPQELQRRVESAPVRQWLRRLVSEERYTEALELANVLLQTELDPSILQLRITIASNLGLTVTALSDAVTYVSVNCTSTVARKELARCLLALDRQIEAIPVLVSYLKVNHDDDEALDLLLRTSVSVLQRYPHISLLSLACLPVFAASSSTSLDSQSPSSAASLSRNAYAHQYAALIGGESVLPITPNTDPFSKTYTLKSIPIEEFECSLCYSLLYEPVATPCGHSFCRECLQRALDHHSSCPICRTDLTFSIRPDELAVCESIHRYILREFAHEHEERKRHSEPTYSEDQDELPIFVCSLAFPGVSCALHVFEPRYRLMMRRCHESQPKSFGMCLASEETSFSDYGTLLRITNIEFLPDGRSIVQTVGEKRFRVLQRGMRDGYHTAKVEWIDDEPDHSVLQNTNRPDLSTEHIVADVLSFVRAWLRHLGPSVRRQIESQFGSMPTNPALLSFWVLNLLPVPDHVKYTFLTVRSSRARLIGLYRIVRAMRRPARDNGPGCSFQ
eukprot:GILK01005268.1.p1 GENE.GILK01005268.1~~GILK01005268.1.p1  ORF type:complete len:716 (+),score=91.37 GILK01005268.1:111-2258(+)